MKIVLLEHEQYPSTTVWQSKLMHYDGKLTLEGLLQIVVLVLHRQSPPLEVLPLRPLLSQPLCPLLCHPLRRPEASTPCPLTRPLHPRHSLPLCRPLPRHACRPDPLGTLARRSPPTCRSPCRQGGANGLHLNPSGQRRQQVWQVSATWLWI